ncbi:hypothetical protein JM654_18165 [Microbacterium oxydans]|nr:hypothetical protein [Microbacterium oxydans]
MLVLVRVLVRVPERAQVPGGGQVPGRGAGAGGLDTTASLTTEMALFTTETGAVIAVSAWVPESSPSSPVVSAAFATVAPKSVMPPAMSVPQRARFKEVRMMVLLTGWIV